MSTIEKTCRSCIAKPQQNHSLESAYAPSQAVNRATDVPIDCCKTQCLPFAIAHPPVIEPQYGIASFGDPARYCDKLPMAPYSILRTAYDNHDADDSSRIGVVDNTD